MKWMPYRDQLELAYESHQSRTIEKFLWFPRTINRETRWLEKAKIIQYVTMEIWDRKRYYFWTDCAWDDDKEL